VTQSFMALLTNDRQDGYIKGPTLDYCSSYVAKIKKDGFKSREQVSCLKLEFMVLVFE